MSLPKGKMSSEGSGKFGYPLPLAGTQEWDASPWHQEAGYLLPSWYLIQGCGPWKKGNKVLEGGSWQKSFLRLSW